MKRNKEKALIGMSGGVDSSVAVHLLKNDGYEVHGVYLKTCNSDPSEAESVAKDLGIDFEVIDVEKDFQKHVIQYFIDTYKEGKTPNPCVICNRYVKFQALIDVAKELHIPNIATGHYAKVEYNRKRNRYILKKGKDKKKDQSYMLYNLTQEQLSKSVFPLGKYTKEDVRAIAKEIGLEVANKPDSQDICFIPDNDYASYIKKNSDMIDREGDIVDINRKVLGKHKGLSKYTVGQRKGLDTKINKALFVVDIDVVKNRLVVGEEGDIYKKDLVAKDMNWISITDLNKRMRVKAKIRYSTKEYGCTIKPIEKGNVSVRFNQKQRAITPGQAIVFYKGNSVVGGGIID
jgi:tRNA-uridine 2-sulfurtransferase